MNYDDFLTLALRRYSCRNYSSEAVSKETIEQILEIAHIAPSACNKQPWKFLVIQSAKGCQTIHSCYSREWIKTAFTFIVALGIHDMAWHRAEDGKDHTDVDLSIAIEHICLAATSLGLGSCWVCNFDAEKLTKALELPDGIEPIAIIPLGYPTTLDVPSKVRKPFNDIVAWENL